STGSTSTGSTSTGSTSTGSTSTGSTSTGSTSTGSTSTGSTSTGSTSTGSTSTGSTSTGSTSGGSSATGNTSNSGTNSSTGSGTGTGTGTPTGNNSSTATSTGATSTSPAPTDSTPPTITITANKTVLAPLDTATVQFTLSEASADFSLDDITVLGGTLSQFQGSGNSYTAILTPSTSNTSALVFVTSDRFSDATGNFNQDGGDVNNALPFKVNNAVVTPPPVAPLPPTAQLSSLSDSGLQGDRITQNSTPTLSGTGTPGHAITVRDATGQMLASATVQANGSWQATPAQALPQGLNALQVVATSPLGLNSPATPLSITVDTVAPTVTIGALQTTLKAGESTTVTFTLSESSQDFSLADVTAIGGSLSQLQGGGQNYSATFTPASGSTSALLYVASERFTDAAGNFNQDKGDLKNLLSLSVSQVPPALPPVRPTLTLSTASDSGLVGDSITNIDKPSFSGTGTPGDTIRLSLASTGEVLVTTVASNGTWSATPSQAIGSGTVSVTATNAAGLVSTEQTLALVIDKSINTPVLSLVCDSGSNSADAISQSGALQVSADAGSRLEYSTNGLIWSSTFVPVEGSNLVSVRATDVAGNVATASALRFTLDTTAPVAPTLALACDSGVSATDLISNNGALSVIAEAGATLQYSTNGSNWGSTFTALEGANTVQVRAVDAAGNTGPASSLGFTLDKTIATPTLSLVCDSGASVSDAITRNGAVSVNAPSSASLQYSTNGSSWATTFAAIEGTNSVQVRATDAAGNVATSTPLSFTLDTQTAAFSVALVCDSGALATDGISKAPALVVTGTEAGATVEYSSNGAVWSSTYSAVEGLNSVQVRVTDTAGNPRTQNFSFTLDSTAPGAPVLTLTCDSGASATDLISSNGALSVMAEAGATLQYSTDGTSWASTFAALEGNNTVKVRAVDAAGNAGPASNLGFTLDKTIATPTLTLVCDSGTSAVDTITRNGAISVNAETGAALQYSTNGSSWATTFAAIEGTNTVQVRATDAAGNVATSAPLSFTLDTQTPAFTVALVCDSGASGADSISKSSALVVTGAETGATVEYSSNGTVWASTYAATEGANSVQVRVTDTAGNQR
ncbi:Ig-like domain-containing protein, partial [Limnohabitans planktonicus]|uniref:Ig-like domain-containing protein n=1 Tax=Limnohabitans planktonicus TaxID=540060 RepID=UPI001F0CDBC2